jgi:hypothetical protein
MQTEDDNAGEADELALEPLSYLRVASALVQNMMQSSLSQVQQSAIKEDIPVPPPPPVQKDMKEPRLENEADAEPEPEPGSKRRRHLLRRRSLSKEGDAGALLLSTATTITDTVTQQHTTAVYVQMQVESEDQDITTDNLLDVPLLPLPLSPAAAAAAAAAAGGGDKAGDGGGGGGSDEDDIHYHMSCSLSELQSGLLLLLRSVLKVAAAAEQDGTGLDTLGGFSDLVWIADSAWNLANLLVQPDKCTMKLTTEQHAPTGRLRTAAECFELAQQLYGLSARMGQGRDMGHVLGRNQYLCLLLAACARLDADSLDGPAHAQRKASLLAATQECYTTAAGGGAGEEVKVGEVQAAAATSLKLAKTDADTAEELLRRASGFEDGDSLLMRKTALMLQFTLLCRAGRALSPSQQQQHEQQQQQQQQQMEPLQALLRSREQDFLLLSAEDLKRCADIACSEPEGTSEAARTMLQWAWQALNRGDSTSTTNATDVAAVTGLLALGGNGSGNGGDAIAASNSVMAGRLFCQMIELSPSREHALEKAREFYELVHASASATGMGAVEGFVTAENDATMYPRPVVSPYSQESIDQIAAVTYNYGVTLAELGQTGLAERFINTAIGLMRYASPEMRQWSRRVEDAYLKILSRDSESSAAGKAAASSSSGSTSTSLGGIFDYGAAGLAPLLDDIGAKPSKAPAAATGGTGGSGGGG